MRVIPKNWGDFQHYKDRNPPWIKLHKGLLDNYDFHCLPVASRALAPMLWLLASEQDNGEIDAAPKRLAFRLRMSEAEAGAALKPLIDNGFFLVVADVVQLASSAQATVSQPACLETEGETEKETEKEEKPRKRVPALDCPDDVEAETWVDWLQLRRSKKAPVTATVLKEARTEAAKAGLTLGRFLAIWCARGSQGLQAEWLKPNERGNGASPQGETAWQRSQRERVAAFAPGVAAKPPGQRGDFIDMEILDVTPIALGR